MSITYGRVPYPDVTVRDLPLTGAGRNVAWDDLGQRVPRFLVIHRMEGTLWGSDEWFRTWDYVDGAGIRRAAGAQLGRTDYGIDAQTGAALRWTDPTGRVAGWASGPWQRTTGRAAGLVRKYGTETVNRDGVSLEVSGHYRDPVGEKGLAKLVALGAYWADRMLIPHTSWPINPATGERALFHHGDFQAEKDCAGKALIALLPTIEKRIGAVLKQYQEGAPVEAPEKPAETPEPGVNGIPYRKLFGALYDDKGTVSALWRETGAKTGRYPPLVTHNTAAGYFQFGDGSVIVRDKAGKVAYLPAAKG